MPVSQISAGSAIPREPTGFWRAESVVFAAKRNVVGPAGTGDIPPRQIFLQVQISVGLKSFIFVSADCAGVSASVFASAEFTRLNLAGVRVEDECHSIRNIGG
jgi:hypothetical protein